MEPARKPPKSQMEVAFQHLEAHMLFVCPECGESFPTQQQWRQHLNFHHDYLCKKAEDFNFVEVNERFHECLTCKAMVADGRRAIALLQYHRFLHLPYSRTYRCLHCPASFTRKRVLCEHLCRNHESIVGQKVADFAKNNLSSCKPADVEGGKPKFLIPPSQASRNAKYNAEFYLTYNCPQCGAQIEDYKKWMMHIKAMHCEAVRPDCEMQRVSGTKNYYCKICRKVIYSSDSARLQRHYFSHMPHRVNFQCAYCKVQRGYKTEILHHFIRTHIREFNVQRKYVKKPVEWGAEVNEDLEKEVDLLLKHGSGFRNSRGSNNLQLTSTTVTNHNQKNLKRSDSTNSLEKSTTTLSKDSSVSETAASGSGNSSSSSSKLSKEKSQENKTKQIGNNSKKKFRCDLEALCAEIFGDIETDGEQLGSEQNEIQNPNQIKSPEESKDSNAKEEEVVSIEINPLYESDLKNLNRDEQKMSNKNEYIPPTKRLKLNDSIQTTTNITPAADKTKTYPTLKALFNAKVLHLCPKCGKSFGEHVAWRDHVLNAHESLDQMIEESYKPLEDQDSNLCLNCMQVLPTTNKSELQRHCFIHMPFHSYLKCTLCRTVKSNKGKMMCHLEIEHISLLDKTKETQITTDKSIDEIVNEIDIKQEAEEKVQKSPKKDCKKVEISHIMKHLFNSHERLIRIESGIETF